MAENRTVEIGNVAYELPFKGLPVFAENSPVCDFQGRIIATTYYDQGECEHIAAALNDYRPWRYPVQGELPQADGEYEISAQGWTYPVTTRYICGDWFHPQIPNQRITDLVYAWRELSSPAPKLENDARW